MGARLVPQRRVRRTARKNQDRSQERQLRRLARSALRVLLGQVQEEPPHRFVLLSGRRHVQDQSEKVPGYHQLHAGRLVPRVAQGCAHRRRIQVLERNRVPVRRNQRRSRAQHVRVPSVDCQREQRLPGQRTEVQLHDPHLVLGAHQVLQTAARQEGRQDRGQYRATRDGSVHNAVHHRAGRGPQAAARNQDGRRQKAGRRNQRPHRDRRKRVPHRRRRAEARQHRARQDHRACQRSQENQRRSRRPARRSHPRNEGSRRSCQLPQQAEYPRAQVAAQAAQRVRVRHRNRADAAWRKEELLVAERPEDDEQPAEVHRRDQGVRRPRHRRRDPRQDRPDQSRALLHVRRHEGQVPGCGVSVSIRGQHHQLQLDLQERQAAHGLGRSRSEGAERSRGQPQNRHRQGQRHQRAGGRAASQARRGRGDQGPGARRGAGPAEPARLG
mmetsp:Transcript_42333/g.49314  ORF Transcript_42333/g.49314 Transcript_42333/m.49314 type:complete len:442 (+) Transcript_42333:6451-7776(+)